MRPRNGVGRTSRKADVKCKVEELYAVSSHLRALHHFPLAKTLPIILRSYGVRIEILRVWMDEKGASRRCRCSCDDVFKFPLFD
jgi:hypothetical protein